MPLPFLRWTSLRWRQQPAARSAAARLDRLAPEDRRPEVVDYSPPRDSGLEPATKPLYESNVYHSRLEELPTFAVNFLSEAAEEQIVQLVESRTP
jgi:hypothetical protein